LRAWQEWLPGRRAAADYQREAAEKDRWVKAEKLRS
jgi:hypothetical protein